jgi:hypothetical protein
MRGRASGCWPVLVQRRVGTACVRMPSRLRTVGGTRYDEPMSGRSILGALHLRSAHAGHARPAGRSPRLDAVSQWRILGDKWSATRAALREDATPADQVLFIGDPRYSGYPTDHRRSFASLPQKCEALAVPLSPAGQA